MSARGFFIGLGMGGRLGGSAFLLIVILASCSPKPSGYIYRDGTKQGVRYKKAISPKEHRTALFYTFLVVSLLVRK